MITTIATSTLLDIHEYQLALTCTCFHFRFHDALLDLGVVEPEDLSHMDDSDFVEVGLTEAQTATLKDA